MKDGTKTKIRKRAVHGIDREVVVGDKASFLCFANASASLAGMLGMLLIVLYVQLKMWRRFLRLGFPLWVGICNRGRAMDEVGILMVAPLNKYIDDGDESGRI